MRLVTEENNDFYNLLCPVAARNTLMASWWRVRCAAWFGARKKVTDPVIGNIVTLAEYKGTWYLIKTERLQP